MLASLKMIVYSPQRICCHYQSKLLAHRCSKTKAFKGPPWRILFFGTDNFSLQSLKALCAKLSTGTLISTLGVVTKRHSTVSKFSEAQELPLHYWPTSAKEVESNYDIGVVVSFGNLIPKAVIEALPLGCINIHASLLPRWRGAAPIIHAVLAGDSETGVTIMKIQPHKFDVGEIVRQYRISIGVNETSAELEKRLSIIGSNLLMECVRDLPKCVQTAIPQPEVGVTYAPKVDHSLSNVDWESRTALTVYNQHRALSHLHPLKTNWHGKIVKLRSISIEPKNNTVPIEATTDNVDLQKSALDFLLNSSERKNEPKVTVLSAGICSYDKANKLLKVVCADGRNIILNTVQVGTKVMRGTDFYNGFMAKINKREWKFTQIDD